MLIKNLTVFLEMDLGNPEEERDARKKEDICVWNTGIWNVKQSYYNLKKLFNERA